MKNNVKIFCSLFLSVTILFLITIPSSAIVVGAETNDMLKEQKQYSYATVEDDFAENRVIVVLKRSQSLNFKTYGVSDFSEVDCKKVRQLNSSTGYMIEKTLDRISQAANTASLKDDLEVSS